MTEPKIKLVRLPYRSDNLRSVSDPAWVVKMLAVAKFYVDHGR